MTQPQARFNPIPFFVLLAVVVIAARFMPGPRNIDDSFIIFRYAENIASGVGFVYNPGVQTLGTTTPLFTVLMALIDVVVRVDAYPWYALAASTLADCATVSLMFVLMRRLTGRIYPALLVGLVWAVAPFSVTFAIGGMETSFVIMWMFATVWALVARRRWLVGLFAGLGLLTRPDAGIWILLVGLYQVGAALTARDADGNRTPSVPWQTWLAGAVTIAPWVGFSWAYFGTPLPNTLGAKSVAYVVPDGLAFISIVQRYATAFMDFDAFGSVGAMTGALVYLTLNLVAVAYVRGREPRLLPLLAFPWLYLVIFGAANPLMFRWYYAPPLPAWIFGIVVGAWALVTAGGKALDRDESGRAQRILYPVAGGVLAVLWLGMMLNAWTLTPDHGPGRPAPGMSWHLIELNYRTVGDTLRDEYGVTPETRVASADIGAVGYYSEAFIIDTVGLITPELSAYYPYDDSIRLQEDDPQNYAVPPALILDTQPEYFVTMEGFIRLGLLTMPEFTENYTLVETIPMDVYGAAMQVYARNDVLR